MNSRIRELRKTLNLTLEEFGKKLGVTRAAISNIENGNRDVTNQMIVSICRGFNVDEEWLRTGKGEMFQHLPEEDETAAFVSELLFDNDNELYTLIKEIMRTYSQLDEKSKETLKQFSKMLLDNLEDTKKQTN